MHKERQDNPDASERSARLRDVRDFIERVSWSSYLQSISNRPRRNLVPPLVWPEKDRKKSKQAGFPIYAALTF
jgi:hypothetical protein